MIVNNLELGLVYIENVIENPKKIINLIEKMEIEFIKTDKIYSNSLNKWQKWEDGNQFFCWQKFIPQPNVLKLKQNAPFYEDQLYISEELFEGLEKSIKEYYNIYEHAKKNIKSREDNINILKYEKGHYLPAHQDQGVSSRVLSGILYLNDEYEGGNINFPYLNISVKPKPGSVIFFPSNFIYVHQIDEIISGTRYSLPHWYHSRINKINSTGQE